MVDATTAEAAAPEICRTRLSAISNIPDEVSLLAFSWGMSEGLLASLPPPPQATMAANKMAAIMVFRRVDALRGVVLIADKFQSLDLCQDCLRCQRRLKP